MTLYRVAMQRELYNPNDAPYFLSDTLEAIEWTTRLEEAALYSNRLEAERDAQESGGVVVVQDVNPSEPVGI